MSRNILVFAIGVVVATCLAIALSRQRKTPPNLDSSSSAAQPRRSVAAMSPEYPGETSTTPSGKQSVSRQQMVNRQQGTKPLSATASITEVGKPHSIVITNRTPGKGSSVGLKHAPVDPRVELAVDRSKTDEERLSAVLKMNQEGARIQFKEDLDSLAEVLADPTEEDTLRHEIALLLLRHDYEPLMGNVLAVLNNPKEEARYRSFCVQHLWLLGHKAQGPTREKIMETLRELLNDKDVPVRREAMLALTQEGDKLGGTTVLSWLNDTNAGAFHDLAIRYVRETDLKDQTPRVRDFLQSTNETARIAALVTLGQWKDERSRAAFEQATQSVNSVRVQRAGKVALERLGTMR